MRSIKILLFSAVLAIGLIALAPFVDPGSFRAAAQPGNSITGFVYGLDRQPMSDLYVELLDDLGRTVQRARTDVSGRYAFHGLRSGRFKVRVMTFATDYEEQEVDVEIVDFTRGSGSGSDRVSGLSNEQKDVYLKVRKDSPLGVTGSVFVQNVPEDAKKKYNAAITELAGKKDKEAFESLKGALEIYPSYYSALELLGTEYVKRGFFEASKVLLQMAVDVNPRGYKSWYGLAYSQYSLKDNESAQASVEKAIDLAPNAPDALLLSGVLLRQKKNYQEAEKRLLKAETISKGVIPEIHWELALLYGNNMQRYGDAAKHLKLFLKARPDSKNADQIKKLIAQFEAKAAEQ